MSNPSGTIQHPRKPRATDTVPIPLSLLQKMSEAAHTFEEFQDELEDYLLSQDAAFLAGMRQARAHHLKGETRSLDVLKHKLCIK